HVRAIDYLQFNQAGHWRWAVQLVAQALVADPLNVRAVVERAARPLRYHASRLPARIRRSDLKISVLVPATGRRLFQLVVAPIALSKRWLGRQVDRVFLRGNRELMLKIDGLQQRTTAIEEALKIDDLQLGGVRAAEEALTLEIGDLQQRTRAIEALALKID